MGKEPERTNDSTSESATKSTKRVMYEKYIPKEKAKTSCYAWYHSHNKASPILAKLCSNQEIFNTKIKNFANFECFTKMLCLENLELYGISTYKAHIVHVDHIQTRSSLYTSTHLGMRQTRDYW